jgi:hypothetical protein
LSLPSRIQKVSGIPSNSNFKAKVDLHQRFTLNLPAGEVTTGLGRVKYFADKKRQLKF